MTSFDQLFATRAFPMLLAQFGERVIYRPAGGVPRPITVIVNRQPISGLPSPQGQAPVIEIQAFNDSFKGIWSGSLDTGGDQIDVAFRKHGKIERRNIGKLLQDAGGVTRVEVR